jgi:hypothetical protein
MANHHASLPIAYRLYLPEEWAKDAARRKKARVPNTITFKTKPEIALEQIRKAYAARRTRGYDDAQARQIFRDLIDMPANVAIADTQSTDIRRRSEEGTFVSIGTVCEQNCGYSISSASASSLLTPRLLLLSPDEP